MEFIRDFSQLSSKDVALAGGKGASLGEMTRAGLPVPPGFAILTTAFDAFQATGSLGKTIDTILEAIPDPKDARAVKAASETIRELLIDTEIPPGITTAVRRAFARLGAESVAVRSSATAEDGATAAWAGQLESYLNTDETSLLMNVKKCWASLFSPRALAYRFHNSEGRRVEGEGRRQEAGGHISIAVVVQKMVDARISGVAFSAHPLTGDTGRIVIEAAEGLGEDLVGGRITPDSYVFDKSSGRIIDRPPLPADNISSGAGASTATLTAGGIKQVLADSDVSNLARLVGRIEDHYGFPVDVEWAADDEFYVVQSRPITTLTHTAGTPNQVWSNMNIAEVLPGVVPPLVKDTILGLVGPAISKLLKLPPDTELATDIKGRLYFNVTGLQAALAKVTGAKDLDVTALLGGEQGKSAMLKQVPAAMKARLIVFGITAGLSALFIQRKYDRFSRDVRATTTALSRRAAETDELKVLLCLEDEALALLESFGTKALLMNAFPLSFYMIFTAVSKRWLSGDGANRAHALLATGGGGLQEIEALADLWAVRDRIKADPALAAGFSAARDLPEALAALEADASVMTAYQAFLDAHGHRCGKELDFSVPRWREDPGFIITMLKTYLKTADSNEPLKRRKELSANQAKLWAGAEAELPRIKSLLLKKLLALAVDGQKKRENTKSEVVKLLLPLRAISLRIGGLLANTGLLDAPNDIFMLRLSELRELAGQADLSRDFFEPALARKAAYTEYEAIDLPAVITDLDDVEAGWYAHASSNKAPGATGADVLTGIAVSRGKVEGIARVIESLDDIDRLAPDDILVTDHTDPGWTPVFATIKGLVTNTGGLISHAAIVAREYGLPAVVNVANATGSIKDGRRILLDADSGTIRLLED